VTTKVAIDKGRHSLVGVDRGGPIVDRFPFLLFSLFFFFFGWPRLSPTLHAPHVAQHEYGGATKLKNIKNNICTVFLKDCITLKTIVALCWLPCHFKKLDFG